MTSTYGITRADVDRAHVSSLASWTTRGEDHPTARLLDLVPGRSGTVHENWLAERGEDFRSGIQIATADPFQGQQERLREAFTADEAHIRVEVAYLHGASVRGLPPSRTRPRPTPGRLSHRAPTSLSHPRNRSPGRTLRKWKDALDAYFDTDGASNGSTEAINGHYRAGQTNRQRLPQPHQLPAPNAPHRRRSRCLHPYSTLKSQYTVRV